MWDKEILFLGVNISVTASLLPDQNIHSSGEISLSHIDTREGFYESSMQSTIEKILFSMCLKNYIMSLYLQ